MKVVKLLDQASEDGPRDSLREQVGDHHDAGEVFDGDDTTADEIAKELGGTQDVLVRLSLGFDATSVPYDIEFTVWSDPTPCILSLTLCDDTDDTGSSSLAHRLCGVGLGAGGKTPMNSV